MKNPLDIQYHCRVCKKRPDQVILLPHVSSQHRAVLVRCHGEERKVFLSFYKIEIWTTDKPFEVFGVAERREEFNAPRPEKEEGA